MNSFKSKFFISSEPFKLPTSETFAGLANYIDGLAKTGFFSRLGLGTRASSEDEPEEGDNKASPFSGLFRNEERIAPPPRFDLSKADEGDDPLRATFVPPETEAPSTLYKDDFFASFDTGEDDKAFADIRRQREEAENHGADEFDFWTTKE